MTHESPSRLIARAKRRRRVRRDGTQTEYVYKPGTTALSYTPRKLNSDAHRACAALLVKVVPMAEAARLLGVSIPTLRIAVRAYHYSRSRT